MILMNPLKGRSLPTFSESSPQRSLRDSAATGKLWQKDRTVSYQTSATMLALSRLQRQVEKLRRRIVGGAGQQSKPGTVAIAEFLIQSVSGVAGLPNDTVVA